MTTMNAQTNWGYAEFQTKSQGRTTHRIALVSPTIDVDVTGYNLNNTGTSLIDHPRDDNLRHREQLLNFQQKYRGTATIQKFRTGVKDINLEPKSFSRDITDNDVILLQNRSARSISQSSLPSRCKNGLKQENVCLIGLQQGKYVLESKGRRVSRDTNQDEGQTNENNVRLLSSIWIEKNNIQNQLKEPENKCQTHETQRSPNESTKVAEISQKNGHSLQKLPDIQSSEGKVSPPHSQPIQLSRSFNKSRNSPTTTQTIDKKTPSPQRIFTCAGDLDPAKIKLQLVEKRREDSRYSEHNGSLADSSKGDSDNKCEDYDDNNDKNDECDTDTRVMHPEFMHGRDCDQKYHGHNDKGQNISLVNTKDDMENLDRQEYSRLNKSINGSSSSSTQTLHLEPGTKVNETYFYKNAGVESIHELDKSYRGSQSAKESRKVEGPKESTNKDNAKAMRRSHSKSAKNKRNEEERGSESDYSLNIPDDRFEPTTHSVENRSKPAKSYSGSQSARESRKIEGPKDTANKDNIEGIRLSQSKSATEKRNEKESESESDDSLDIPDDRYGPTTHSIDRKLSIRKPWEWRPSPYRWIDRDYVRESDKPYIERILNTGEIIDEFDYDSFARTRPLKLQSFPGGAGYKKQKWRFSVN